MVRFGSVRFGSVSPLRSAPVRCLVLSCLVRSSPTTLGHAPVQSPFGAARGAGLGQVPAERLLDASVRSRRSGRSTPRSGPGGAVARRPRVLSCLGHAPVSVTVRRRSRGGPRSGTPRYPSSVRFGSVRFGAIQIGPLQFSVQFINLYRSGQPRVIADSSSPVN